MAARALLASLLRQAAQHAQQCLTAEHVMLVRPVVQPTCAPLTPCHAQVSLEVVCLTEFYVFRTDPHKSSSMRVSLCLASQGPLPSHAHCVASGSLRQSPGQTLGECLG